MINSNFIMKWNFTYRTILLVALFTDKSQLVWISYTKNDMQNSSLRNAKHEICLCQCRRLLYGFCWCTLHAHNQNTHQNGLFNTVLVECEIKCIVENGEHILNIFKMKTFLFLRNRLFLETMECYRDSVEYGWKM